MAKTFEIRLLGELTVVREGRNLPLPASKKTRALLGYLVATGQAHLRERLCELLWDGPDDPRAALRWSLTKLRPLVDEARSVRLVADRERVGFDLHGAEIDLHAVRALVGRSPADASLEALRAAAPRLRGELLDGLDLPDCFRFAAWCAAERDSARALRAAVLDALIERLADEPKGAEEALEHARARVSVDPLVELAHAQVVRCLATLGRGRDALRHYHEARTLLTAELGARPSGDLERARDAINTTPAPRSAAPEPAATPSQLASAAATPPQPSHAADSPLVGRRDEHALIERLVAAAAAGESHPGLLLVGEPGIGKSRLLEELVALVRGAGGRVLGGRAFEAEMVRPYGAWIDALRPLTQADVPDVLGADVAPLLPSLAAAAPTDRQRLFDAVVRLLRGLASPGRPLAVVLDDIHWLDEAGAALLSFAARELATSHVLLATAARPGELADNSAARKAVRALDRDRRIERRELAPLDAAEIAALVRRGAQAPEAARVFAESGGNPLFALEVARALDSGREASETLDELIHDRLLGFEGRARELLPFAAALGRSFSLPLLAGAAGLAPADLLSALDDLERHGVLRATPAGTFDFAHDLVRRAAYRALSEPRRRLCHQQIAQCLAKLADGDGSLAGDLAHHAALGGDLTVAARACLRAGERCLKLFAQAEAEKLAQRGLSHLAALPAEARLPLEMPLFNVLVHARHAERQASRQIEAAISLAILNAERAGAVAEVQLGFHLLSVLSWRVGDVATASDSSLKQAEAGRSGDPATAARALAISGACLLQMDREGPRAVKLAIEAAQIAERHHLEVAPVAWAAGLAHRFTGELDQAVGDLRRAVDQHRQAEDHWGTCLALLDWAMTAVEAGAWSEVHAQARAAEEVARRIGEGSEAPFARALDALAARALDEPGAQPRLDQTIGELRSIDAQGLLAYALNAAAELAHAAGHDDEAREKSERALVAAAIAERRTEQVIGHALLLRLAGAAKDDPRARVHREALTVLTADPSLLSSRARRRLSRRS